MSDVTCPFFMCLNKVIRALQCFSGDSSNIDNGHHGFLHGLDGTELVRPVEIQTASKDVRARESHE